MAQTRYSAFLLLVTSSCALAQSADLFKQQDARLNADYKQRMAQLSTDPQKQKLLREQERAWVKTRDRQCGKDAACLTRLTRARAEAIEAELSGKPTPAGGNAGGGIKKVEPIPASLIGSWKITRVLPTNTVSCWSQKQADALLGTTLVYTPDSLRWEQSTVDNRGATVSSLTAEQFAEDNSGSGSQVSFHALGIQVPQLQQVAIAHPDVDINGSGQMPGDTVLLKSPALIVFSACNVYFEAQRLTTP